jgi:cytochrome c-type biogenesis protein CcmH/NrfF
MAVILTLAVVLAPDPAEDRARALGERIRCPVCQGESIADSPSDSARDMMDLVRTRIEEGRTDQQIIEELVASFSGSVLLDPPPRGSTIWLWVLPVAAIGVGTAVVLSRFRPKSTTEASTPDPVPAMPFKRTAIGSILVLGVAAIAVAAVGQFRQARVDDLVPIDPAAISNETLEAVIAANRDDPQIIGMRLALANRYFEEGDYQRAFPHYEAIIEAEPTPVQAGAALTRLGWMVFDGNGEVDLAINLIDQALEAVPADPFALYLKGRVVWCGKDDPVGASDLFGQVLAATDLEAEVRASVEADLASARAGDSCE